MISRYNASLNGIALSDLSADIIVLNIGYPDPGRKMDTYTLAKRDGARIQRAYKPSAGCVISFAIRQQNTAIRQQTYQQICAWARDGGILKVSDRPGQMLRCVCDSLPVFSSARDWTNPMEITFTAYEQPYWQDVSKATLSLSDATVSGTLYVPGSAEKTQVEATITAAAALTSITLTVDQTSMTLSNLGLSSGQTVVISYDEQMILSIKRGNTSLLNRRTGDDDLLARCGKTNNVSIDPDGACTVLFSTRGLWQ